MVGRRIVRRVLPGQDLRSDGWTVDDRAAEGDGIQPVLMADVVGDTGFEIGGGIVEVDRGILEPGAEAGVFRLRRTAAVAVEVVVLDDRAIGAAQLDTKRAGPVEAALVDDHWWWIGRREGGEDRVIPNRARRARDLKRQAGGVAKRHRAAERDVFDVEGRRNGRGGAVEAQLDALGTDVVHGPKFPVRPIRRRVQLALDQDWRVGGIDAVEVRRPDAAADNGQTIGELGAEIGRVDRSGRAARDRDRVECVLNTRER